MALIHQYGYNQNSGIQISDNIGAYHLSIVALPAPMSVNSECFFASGRINDTLNVKYLPCKIRGLALNDSDPIYAENQVEGTGSIGTNANGSIAFWLRVITYKNGTFIRFHSGTYFRTWNGAIQLHTTDFITQSEYKQNEWIHIAFVRDGANTLCYLNGAYKSTLAVAMSLSGQMRLFGYANTTTPLVGAAELHDIRIYDAPISAADILALANSYGTFSTSWNVYNDGSDAGGFTEYTEYAPSSAYALEGGRTGFMYSRLDFMLDPITSAKNVSKLIFGGDTCIGGRCVQIPYSLRNSDLWFSYELYVYSTFVGDHNFGDNFNFFMIPNVYNYRYTSNETIRFFYEHTLPSNDIDRGSAIVKFVAGDSTVALTSSAAKLPTNQWVKLEMYVSQTSNILRFWLNDIKAYESLAYDYGGDQTCCHFGLWQGVHPDDSTKFILMRNLWAGQTQYSSSSSSSNSNGILTNSGQDSIFYLKDFTHYPRIIVL